MSPALSQWRDQTPDAVWAELQRLQAELARLTPLGQVAEDMELLRRIIAPHGDGEYKSRLCGAISRLATQAQGYEAMEARAKAIFTELTYATATVTAMTQERDVAQAMLAEREVLLAGYREREGIYTAALAQMERERDNACTSEAAWRKRMEAAAEALGDVLPGECGRLDIVTRVKALKEERDAAVADNAALTQELRDLVEDMGKLVARGVFTSFVPHPSLAQVLSQPHPGAALLAEHATALVRARNKGLEEAAKSAERTVPLRAGCSCPATIATFIRAKKESES